VEKKGGKEGRKREGGTGRRVGGEGEGRIGWAKKNKKKYSLSHPYRARDIHTAGGRGTTQELSPRRSSRRRTSVAECGSGERLRQTGKARILKGTGTVPAESLKALPDEPRQGEHYAGKMEG